MMGHVSWAYGPRGVAHVVEYVGNREPSPFYRPVEAPKLWESVCGYRVRFAYPELRLAGHPQGDGPHCDDRGMPLTPWCERCRRISVAAGSALYSSGLLDGLTWVVPR